MFQDQKLHFISLEVQTFLHDELKINSFDIIIPNEFNPEMFDGSHINWTKERSKFCYIRKHKLNLFDLDDYEDLYNYEKRFSGSAVATSSEKFRKVFTRCGVELSTNAQEKLDAYFATINSSLEYQTIDKPSDIYCLGRDIMSGSCMQGLPKSYFEMYDEEECFKLLVVYANESVVGRALLALTDNKIYMDRRYANNYNIQLAMKEYGISQGWYVKSSNDSYDVEYWIHANDVNHDTEVNLNINLKKYTEYPYMDTFKYGFLDSCILSTQSCKPDDTRITLDSTGGGYSEYFYCGRCDDQTDDSYSVHDSDLGEIDVCNDCRDDHYTCCDACDDFTDNCTHTSNDRYICEDCLEDYSKCDECEEYSHCDSVRYFSNCEVSLCDNCL